MPGGLIRFNGDQLGLPSVPSNSFPPLFLKSHTGKNGPGVICSAVAFLGFMSSCARGEPLVLGGFQFGHFWSLAGVPISPS